MLQVNFCIAILFCLLSTALTTPVDRRAGAPIGQPVDDCDVKSVYPSFTGWGYGFVPSVTFASTNGLYSYILNEDFQLVPSEEGLVTNCLETCRGYGLPGMCKGVYFAYNFPDWTEGGSLGTDPPAGKQAGCVLFSQVLEDADLVQPTINGTYKSARAENIKCPNSS